ncbi:hypothetical protein FC831_10480 [Clostridium botulinum]|nr:hypothetical protein [Clostridium botulinum]
METKRIYGIDNQYSYDGSVIIGDEGEECETDTNSMYEWLQETLEIDCSYNEKDIIIQGAILSDAKEVIDYLKIYLDYYCNLSICNYRDEETIVQDTMFLTLRECQERIKRNSYHYNHPYAMTAFRSPQVEKLYKILQETNWNELKEDN